MDCAYLSLFLFFCNFNANSNQRRKVNSDGILCLLLRTGGMEREQIFSHLHVLTEYQKKCLFGLDGYAERLRLDR